VIAGLADFGARAAAFLFALGFAFRFGTALGFGFDLLIPGIVWPSCWASTSGAETRQNTTTTDKTIARLNSEIRLFITPHRLKETATSFRLCSLSS
jgi:hypothetical protein